MMNDELSYHHSYHCSYKNINDDCRLMIIALTSYTYENMQLNNSSIVFKTCVPEFLTRPTINFDGLCSFNELFVQNYELVL